jgi:cytoskeletal protein CcmA (bactofilin family)
MKRPILLAALLFSLLLPFGAAYAFEVKVDNSIHLNKEEIADGNIYANCQEMTIDGTVNGDIIALCQKIVINGTVEGDVIAFGQNIEINGEVKGNTRLAGPQITINGVVGHNVNVLGNDIKFTKNSAVKWDVLVAGVNGTFDGNIDGNLHGLISAASISGKVGRNINLTIDDSTSTNNSNLVITKEAVIAGNINYTATKDLTLESTSSVSGQINKEARQVNTHNNNWLWMIFYKLSSLILVAIVLISLNKKSLENVANKISDKWWQSLLIGLAVLFFTPLAIILLMLTIVGLPLSLIILAFYLSAILLSLIFSSYYLGNLIFKAVKFKNNNVYLITVVGLTIFTLLSFIPFLGWFISLLAITVGLGSLLLIIKK